MITLDLLRTLSITVGKIMANGSCVVYEPPVYPRTTEAVCLPILQQESGFIFVVVNLLFNAFTTISDPEVLDKIASEINGRLVQQRIDDWINRFFRFNRGKNSTFHTHRNNHK